jgi:DNA-binding transcriptional regulator YdaS (Cro superfamily)
MDSMHPLKAWIDENTTQAKFAREVGMSESFLSGILAGTKRVSLEMAARIARATDGAVPIEAFLSTAGAQR